MLKGFKEKASFLEKFYTGLNDFFMSVVARSWGRVPSKSRGVNGVIITENKNLDFSRAGDSNPVEDLELKK
ncbi:MAG: hypothetical protein WAV40_03635 [Microgenomates group bacterium]